MNKQTRAFIEWLKPIARNEDYKIEDTFNPRVVQSFISSKNFINNYDPYKSLWASVILSGIVTDIHTDCNNINIDREYIEAEAFKEDLDKVGCKIPANELRKYILEN